MVPTSTVLEPVSVFSVIGWVLASLGGGGVVVFGLSAWLGRVWATRMMAQEKQRLDRELQEHKARLEIVLSQVNTVLATFKEKELALHGRKTELYRNCVPLVTDLLTDAYYFVKFSDQSEAQKRKRDFHQKRTRLWAELALFAPPNVVDAFTALTDYMGSQLDHGNPLNWQQVRELGVTAVNAARADLGLAGEIVTTATDW